jgi:predicted ATPase
MQTRHAVHRRCSDREEVRHIFSGLSAQHALSKEVVEGVAERTCGVPLFIEELTRLLLGGPDT